MSLTEEYQIRNRLDFANYYNAHLEENETYEKKCMECLQEIDGILKKNIRETFLNISYETVILFVETAIRIKNAQHYAKYYLDLFFQRNQTTGQIYIRALLIQARVVAHEGVQDNLKAEDNINNLKKALSYVNEALNLIAAKPEIKQKYAFLVYNASVCTYHIIRPMFRQSWQKFFNEIVERLVKMLEEVNEPDHSWLCRFLWCFYHCLNDAEKKADANKVFEKLWELTKKKGDCDFQESLFRLRIDIDPNKAQKDADTAPPEKAWKELVRLQKIKSGHSKEVEKELRLLIDSISPVILTGNELLSKLSPALQERLAEAGRIAVSNGYFDIVDAVIRSLNQVPQPSQKATILLEYMKAEYMVKKAGHGVDPKTNMRLNPMQIKKQEIERRIDVLRQLEKVMVTNRKVNDPELIYEGAVLIWNISLPFINAIYRSHLYKAFNHASNLLEMTKSPEYQLRVNLYLEIAKIEIEDEYYSKAEINLQKALNLDYSVAVNKIQAKPDEGEDIGLYQRPYDRYLNWLKKKIVLKQNLYKIHEDDIERVITDLETIASSKNENTRMEVLQKCLGVLGNIELKKHYYRDPALELVKEEFDQRELKFNQENLTSYKHKKMLAKEIASYAFDWELAEIAIKASEYVIDDQWQVKNASEMILCQVESHYILALSYIDLLLKNNYEIAFKDPIKLQSEEQGDELQEEPSEEEMNKILYQKEIVVENFIDGLKKAESIQQAWLIFNGAVYIWNNYLPVFRNPANDSRLHPGIFKLLQQFFEAMKNYTKELEKKYIIDYDLDNKIQVFANIGIIYARLLENQGKHDEVVKACDAMLPSPRLNPHAKKLINSIKARNSGVSKPIGGKSIKEDKGSKGGQQGGAVQNNDQLLFDVVSQLEIIQNNTNKSDAADRIKKCFETLETWKAKENDETELELHAELWARLAKLSLNENLYKYGLRCVESSLSLLNPNAKLAKIPSSRLRWYSLAEYLYADTLCMMLNEKSQEKESQETLLFYALKHSLEAANKGAQAAMNILVLDAAKQFWNICTRLQESAANRKRLIYPIFSLIGYMKDVREVTEPDLILLLAKLLSLSALENQDYQNGEKAVDMAFELVPKALQKSLWESKMIFMSKQGKNELQAISNMREADASLQSKIWLKLARASNSKTKQFTAYTKAVEILKEQDSVDIADVLIEFSEWLLRNGYDYKQIQENLYWASDMLFKIEVDEDDDDDDDDEGEEDRGQSNVYSRSSRGKRSSISRARSKGAKTLASKQGEKKRKANDQKSIVSKASGKSKQTSRLSRASIRSTKTIKKKQAKSIFTEREEDPNPESLNCSHFEKLFRIHVMLAVLAKNNQDAIRFGLDAKLFLIKIFELSFRTMNQLEQNAAKLEKMNKDDKGLVKNPGNQPVSKSPQNQSGEQPSNSFQFPEIKYLLPDKLEDWITYQPPKDFLEKIKTIDTSDIMSKTAFEKPELTYFYLNQLIKIFENVGLDLQCVEVYVFLRFFAKEILGNVSNISVLVESKYARLVNRIGLASKAEEIYNSANPSIAKFFPSEQEKKNMLQKIETSVINSEQDAVEGRGGRKAYIIRDIPLYSIWIEFAQELIYRGEVHRAKLLLGNAKEHATILKDTEQLSLVEHLSGKVAYFEGDFIEGLQHLMNGQRYERGFAVWRSDAELTYKFLRRLGKTDDIDMFFKQVTEVFEE